MRLRSSIRISVFAVAGAVMSSMGWMYAQQRGGVAIDPDDRPSLGLAVLLRHGMAAWLRAWAMCPRPLAPVSRVTQAPELPPIVHTELVRVWAHMALSHEEATWR